MEYIPTLPAQINLTFSGHSITQKCPNHPRKYNEPPTIFRTSCLSFKPKFTGQTLAAPPPRKQPTPSTLQRTNSHLYLNKHFLSQVSTNRDHIQICIPTCLAAGEVVVSLPQLESNRIESNRTRFRPWAQSTRLQLSELETALGFAIFLCGGLGILWRSW
ncbi:hypothetical protein DL98DRAFT_187282 [Cadophora sp. DSE1049]|nr:hypothetical protein DL98DRAFT_187282 [Cadophora sp. DSE1049]